MASTFLSSTSLLPNFRNTPTNFPKFKNHPSSLHPIFHKPPQLSLKSHLPPKSSIPHSPTQSTPTIFTSFTHIASAALLGSIIFIARFNFNPRPVLAVTSSVEVNQDVGGTKKMDVEDGDEEMSVKMLEQNPRDAEALKMAVYAKMKKGKTAEAVGYVERLIEVEPEEVEWRLLQALSYELMGKLGEAKRLFKEILEERPLLIRALHGLALAMYKNREGPAAFKMLNKALDIASRENRVTEERNIKILIAQMHVVKGDLEAASRRFQDLVTEDPRDFRPYLCQGIIYSLLERNEEADEQFEIYRSLVPDELPQRGFIDDAIMAAKTEYQEELQRKT